MKKIHIKESNYWMIRNFISNDVNKLEGSKLESLYKLIQKKGELAKTKDPTINGVKVLEYDKGSFIGFIHVPVKMGSFFPCKLSTISMQEL
jgi:hypothetical protein